jgi:hypothetical protein
MPAYVEIPRFIPSIHNRGVVSIPRTYWPLLRKSLADRFGATLTVRHINGGRHTVTAPYAVGFPFYYIQVIALRDNARAVASYLKGALSIVVEECTTTPRPFGDE